MNNGHGPRSNRDQEKSPSHHNDRLTRAPDNHSAPMIPDNNAICSATAGPQPINAPSETAPMSGNDHHQSMCRLAQKQPTQKNTSTTAMRTLPPAAVNKVPDAQPPPNCMPMPKMKAPNTIDHPTGATAPDTGWPKASPAARNGANKLIARASIRHCATMPEISRSTITFRYAPVNPKAAW